MDNMPLSEEPECIINELNSIHTSLTKLKP
jgi:hypothetical protein